MPTTKRSAGKNASKKAPAAKKPATHYTDDALRDRLKKKIIAGTKGGRAGQWSARKAQLLAHEYEAAGGKYTGGRGGAQKHLKKWTEEKWQTADGKPAKRGKTMARYLPEKAWGDLSPAEKQATDSKKRSASKKGEQFVANTSTAKRAGAKARATTKRTTAKKPRARRSTAR